MKGIISVFILFLYVFSFQPTIFAASNTTAGGHSVYDTIQKGEKAKDAPAKTVDNGSSTSLFPLFIKFIFSFILVVGLLILLLRYLSRRSRTLQSSGPVIPLGGQPLGNNRSLQIVLIGQTIYIIGVGDTVTLLRTISQGEEYQHLLENIENQPDGVSTKWLTGDPKKLWNDIFQKQIKKIRQENGEE